MSSTTSTPAPKTRLHSLTSLRFFAAAFVVVHHTLGPDDVPIVDLGFLGVTFFFVLSGFVLTWAGSADQGAWTSYRNRFARIYPLHLLTLVAALVVPLALEDNGVTLLQNLTLTQAWTDAGAHSFNYVSWSISCEAFFYLLFPAVIVLARRLSTATLLWVGAGAWALQSLLAAGLRATNQSWSYFFWTYDLPLYRFPEFLVGVALAMAMTRGWRPGRRLQRVGVAVAAGGLLVILACDLGAYYATRALYSAGFVPAVVVALYAAVAAEQQGRAGILQNRWLRMLGDWSFALYMVHMLVLRVLADLTGASEPGYFPVWSLAPIFVLCVAVAGAAHVLVERPAERVLRSPRRGDRASVERAPIG